MTVDVSPLYEQYSAWCNDHVAGTGHSANAITLTTWRITRGPAL